MHHGRAEILLRAVVGRFHIVTIQEDEQAAPVFAVPPLQAPAFPHAQWRPEDQPLGRFQHSRPSVRELLGGERAALPMQTDPAAEDVPQLAHPALAVWSIRLFTIREVANLMT